MPESRDPQLDDLRRRARRRLVGAVVLALAAAVLVPLLLESDPRPLGEDVAVRIPPVDDQKFVSKVGERGKDVAAAPKPDAKLEPRAEAKVEAKAAPKIEVRAEPTAEAKPEPRPGAKPEVIASPTAPPPAPLTAAEPAKEARAAAEGPRDAAVAKSLASAEQRVLAPPARSAAPAAPAEPAPPARSVEPVKPATVAAATPASDPTKGTSADPAKAGGFSVQLAAFIDDKGANSLAGKLKKSGYPAYTEPYTTSRGTLWRVRVGPYASRDAAEAARGKLKADGQNGIITAAR